MDALLVGLISLAAVVLFVRERYPPDVIAVFVLGLLAVLNLVTPAEAISGFSSSATITVGAMFLLSAGLRETGALSALARVLRVVGIAGPVLLLAMMAVVAAVSAFINNTAAVAVLLPVVIGVARRRGIAASKLLIPLSYASQFGGVCTLIGTSTNLVVNSLAVSAGLAGFGLFDFAPVGLVLAAVGMLYLLTVGWFLLPSRQTAASATDAYALSDYLCTLAVPADGPLVGRSVAKSGLARGGDVKLLEIVRHDERVLPQPGTMLQADDRLIMHGAIDDVFELARRRGLRLEQGGKSGAPPLEGDGLQLVELVVSPRAGVIGRSIGSLESDWSDGTRVIATARHGEIIHASPHERALAAGDALLVLVDSASLPSLREDGDFIVLSEREDPAGRRGRAPLALAIVGCVVVAAAMKWQPIEIAALLGAAAMAVTRCLALDRLYRHVELRVLVLLAAMLPLGIAMKKSGAASALVDAALFVLPEHNPLVALAIVYLLTALLTEFITNTAAAVLMTPIALALAAQMGIQPAPLLVAVAMAASTSFSTPIGYQTNTMVHAAGGYAFADFLRVGIPLNLIFWVAAMWAIPRWFPF